MKRIDFMLRGQHIALDALLKATGLADSGGAAKQLVAAGAVRVDGQTELRRGAKMRAGQAVCVHEVVVHVQGGGPEGTE